MSVNEIIDRSLSNPLFNIQESNNILKSLKELFRSKKVEESKTKEGPINVYFSSTLNPHSIFYVKYVDKSFNIVKPITDSNTTVTPSTTKHSQANILCTNGEIKAKAGSILGCFPIGYETPHLIKYSGTTPDFGDKLRAHISNSTVIKRAGGELLAVSKPQATRSLIWVIRHQKIREIYGKTTGLILYGSKTGTINIWRNELVTNPIETETIWFTWLGVTGQSIPAGTKIEAKWWDDLDGGNGAYRVSNSNCIAQ